MFAQPSANAPQVTPGQAAKSYARAYPEFSGALIITSLQPKGRGGWGQARKETQFYLNNGRAAQARGKLVHGLYYYNGQCGMCGRVVLGLDLAPAYAPDPQAGQPLPDALRRPAMTAPRLVLADMADCGRACPECVAALGWLVGYAFSRWIAPDTYAEVRLHPAVAARPARLECRALDLRPRSATLRQLPTTAETPETVAAEPWWAGA